jgi:hypothetical protein
MDHIVNARVPEMLNPLTLLGTAPASKSSWEIFPNPPMPESSPPLARRHAITIT